MPEHPKTIARHAALRAMVASEKEEFAREDFANVDASVRAFAREIYSGTMRHRGRLDWSIAPLLKKPIEKLDAPVRAALRLALYEKLVLNTPDRALANEYTELMRSEKLKSATGFINAVTRRLPTEWREATGNEGQRLSIEFSHPRWLVDRYIKRFGPQETRALLEFNSQIAPLCLRVNSLKTTREALLNELPNSRAGTHSPDAIIYDSGDVTSLPAWQKGEIFVQDEAAQLVSRLAAPRPGDFVIDCAAAPGGKTTHLAQLMNNRGSILALDSSAKRLEKVVENASRLDISIIKTRAGDLRVLGSEIAKEGRLADVVTLDAPCLGTGTLRRRPDAKWRKTPQQLNQLLGLQAELLDAAAKLVKQGGVLVYSTCSIESEENERQVQAFLERNGDFLVERAPATLETVATSEGYLNTFPQRHSCDGMFAVRFKRQEN